MVIFLNGNIVLYIVKFRFEGILSVKCYGWVWMVLYILFFDVKVVKFGLCWIFVRCIIGIIGIIIIYNKISCGWFVNLMFIK